MTERLETLLAELPFLAPLRRDELHRAARRFELVDLAPGESRQVGENGAQAVVVLGGEVSVEASPLEGHGPVRATLEAGDHVGALSVVIGRALPAIVRAE